MQIEREKFEQAIRRFDEANAADPNLVTVDGRPEPRELAHARWLTEWVRRLEPGATQELLLAARAQHICRWLIPRESYPMNRAGYLQWRQKLKRMHASKAAEILKDLDFPKTMIERVEHLILKKDFPNDSKGRVLEDALCLVFLEHQFEELARKTTEEKVINALQKSWKKMSPSGQAAALKLDYGDNERQLLEKALKERSSKVVPEEGIEPPTKGL